MYISTERFNLAIFVLIEVNILMSKGRAFTFSYVATFRFRFFSVTGGK